MPSEVALVTGGGRGIGANIARELAGAGWRVAVSARTASQVEAVSAEVGGLAVECDVSSREQVEAMVARVESELGPVALLVNNAGVSGDAPGATPDPDAWWQVFEINVRGAFLCAHAVLPGMLERGAGRIVNMGSGASYLPGGGLNTAYGASKAALGRWTELLQTQLRGTGVNAFLMSPGLVRTDMTSGAFPADAPWTPPELAPRLVRAIAEGRLDKLAGRYLHAEHDPVDQLEARADEIVERDLNALRLRREG